MTSQFFIKMHALGNDFVIMDARETLVSLANDQVRFLADRNRGIGCDQLILLEKSQRADLFMRIFNADGGEVEACGNAARCIGLLLIEKEGHREAVIETRAGLLRCASAGNNQITVDMGTPRLDWESIPLSKKQDTLNLDIDVGPLKNPVAVNMGNPHAVLLVSDCSSVDLKKFGPILETDSIFPERANISIAEIVDTDNIRLRVWERGVGITLACGTAACATLVAANLRGAMGREANMLLDGGVLHISWQKDGRVMMTGPATTSFSGSLEWHSM